MKQYDPQTARQTILKRTPPDEFPVSVRVMDNIDHLYAYLKGRSDGAITRAKVEPLNK